LKEYITDDVIAGLLLKNYFRLLELVLPATESRLVAFCLSLVSPVWQWLAPLTIEKDLKPAVSSNSMDEDRSQKDAALSHSDGGPLRQVRDPGGLESEGLTLRSGSVLKGRSPHISQISDPQAMVESSAVIAQGQAALSQSESESAITHAVSASAADLSRDNDAHCRLNSPRLNGDLTAKTVAGLFHLLNSLLAVVSGIRTRTCCPTSKCLSALLKFWYYL